MKIVFVFVVACVLHAAMLLFGGLIFSKGEGHDAKKVVEVDLTDVDDKKDLKPEEPEKTDEPVVEQDKPPEISQQVAAPEAAADPADRQLDAMSIADISAALGGGDGAPGFGSSGVLGSGGRIGGTGPQGGGGGGGDEFVAAGDLAQKPRELTTVNPVIPPASRAKGGLISAILFVNERGDVTRVEFDPDSDSSLNEPARDALTKWKFEPGQREGRKVGFKVRKKIRIPPKNA